MPVKPLPAGRELDGADWYDLENDELLPLWRFPLPVLMPSSMPYCSLMGGGVVSAEL